jgi:hypothetical protein
MAFSEVKEPTCSSRTRTGFSGKDYLTPFMRILLYSSLEINSLLPSSRTFTAKTLYTLRNFSAEVVQPVFLIYSSRDITCIIVISFTIFS